MRKKILFLLIVGMPLFCFAQNRGFLNNELSKISVPGQAAIVLASSTLNYSVLASKQNDKFGHWFVSYSFIITSMQFSPEIGLIAGVGIEVTKEIYDVCNGGIFSLPDMYANLSGVLFAVCVYVFQHYDIIYKKATRFSSNGFKQRYIH